MPAAGRTLWTNIAAATMDATRPGAYGLIADAAVLTEGERIVWVGPRASLPQVPEARPIDGRGGVLTPGLIDCHTHLVHGGDRAQEFERRLNGASYEDIARAGGGIASTVRATREADEDALVAAALPRLDSLLAEGVTTIEIKSGYGLALETETRMLRAARRLALERPVEVRATFLGAHATPPEFKDSPQAYIDVVCETMIPAIAAGGLAEAVDAFCETIGFSAALTRRVFEAARAHGLPVKLHAGQMSDLGGAELVAEFAGLSADHLEHLSQRGVEAMASAGTVAVLLPGAFYCLRAATPPPVKALRAAGVPMALSTDCNPGTSPIASLLLMLNMGCVLLRLTPEEALAGVTRAAAQALGLADRGVIRAGLRADLAVWDVPHPAHLSYAVGINSPRAVMRAGVLT